MYCALVLCTQPAYINILLYKINTLQCTQIFRLNEAYLSDTVKLVISIKTIRLYNK